MDNWHVYNKQNTIKILAVILMIIDHIGSLFNITELRVWGHLGITLFLYSFISGLKISKGLNLKKGIILLLTAIIAQPFYMYLFSTKCLNILFLYLLYYGFKYIESKNSVINIIQFVLFCGLSIVLNIEYVYFGFTILYICDKVKNIKIQYILITIVNVSFVIFGLVMYKTLIYLLQPTTIYIIHLVNSNKLSIEFKINRYVFYVFYPAHLIILSIIKLIF